MKILWVMGTSGDGFGFCLPKFTCKHCGQELSEYTYGHLCHYCAECLQKMLDWVSEMMKGKVA